MTKNHLILLLLPLALTLLSCNHDNNKGLVVAKCYNYKLYESDLTGLTTSGMSPADSIERVNNFINSWISQHILLNQAERNLRADQLDFSKELKLYRNSLVVYAYETQLIEQKLDTIVPYEEVEQYYEQNKNTFHSHHDMVKVVYAVVNTKSKSCKAIRELLSDKDTLRLQQFDELAQHEALTYSSDVDSWVRLEDFTAIVPLEINNPQNFFNKNKFVAFEDDDNTILVRFEDYILQDEMPPMEMEYDNIKSLILLKRKQELLRQMNTDLYNIAVKENAFEVY